MNEKAELGPVVFFDGECGLCDRFVKFLIQKDKAHRLRFATLQGETARSNFPALGSDPDLWSVRYVRGGRGYVRSAAAIRAISSLGGLWTAANAILIVPRFIRDGVYKYVATHRYRWFGKFDACMLPSPTLRERFLP